MRIVSLLASGTEIVCALGAGASLIGRSHECDNPSWVHRLPPLSEPAFDTAVSSLAIDTEVRRRIRAGEPLYEIHSEQIQDLRPDLILTQAHCDVCAITPADVEKTSAGEIPQLVLSAFSLDDIFSSIRRIGKALGLERRAAELVQREQVRLNCVKQKTSHLYSNGSPVGRPTLAMLEWTEPLFAMGNWGPELVEFANADLVTGHKGEYSAAITGEELCRLDPEYIIVAPCGFNLERTLREQAVLESYPWWDRLQAVRNGRVFFADGNLYFNRSGMTISRTAEIIAEIVHGVSFDSASSGMEWRPCMAAERQ
jgi:iron complex transport system substrate-binding protein